MSADSLLERHLEKVQTDYFARTPGSRRLHERATRFLPEGDTRAAVYFQPYPTYIERGDGCFVYDVDGNEYIDHLGNFTVQIHGHNTARIREAAREQLGRGTSFGAPHEKQVELAEILCQRVPSLERIRFCNSGTEATMFAIRAARAFTGRSKIVKMEGIYHGTHDNVGASVFPPLELAGGFDSPALVPFSPGIPPGVLDHIVIAPFNNLSATEAIIEAHKDDLAGVIIEPVMTAAGVIPADMEYLQFLRDITRKLGVVLIFDEVVTLRLAPGGAQEIFRVTPDLTAMGKFIGGGLPFGAFGGREDIMAIFSPKNGKMSHSGTFNGHPVTMAAGVEAMKMLDREAYRRLNQLGDLFRERLNRRIFGALGLKVQALGLGSISIIHYCNGPIKNYREARKASEEAGRLPELVHLGQLNNGIWIAERGEFALSTPMNEEIIDRTVEAFGRTFLELRPVVEKHFPHLVAA
ncbi:MAG: aspartate aminotransferase family protein [Thermodesulfobacteriota bacterium]